MNLHGEKVVLRAIEERDCEILKEMFNSPDIEEMVIGWAYPLSSYAQKQWFQQHYGDNNVKTDVLRLVISDREDNALGLVILSEIDWKNRTALTGLKILNTQNRARGIGTDTMLTLMKYAFDELQLHRLEAVWLVDNIASATLHKKVGYKEEGLKRQAIFKNGKYHDVCCGAILADEYHEMMRKKADGEG